MKQQKLNSKEYYINEINRLKEEKRLVEQELKKTQAELYRAHLEKDVYEKAAEILNANMEKLHVVAGILLEKEKIDGEEFDAIFNN